MLGAGEDLVVDAVADVVVGCWLEAGRRRRISVRGCEFRELLPGLVALDSLVVVAAALAALGVFGVLDGVVAVAAETEGFGGGGAGCFALGLAAGWDARDEGHGTEVDEILGACAGWWRVEEVDSETGCSASCSMVTGSSRDLRKLVFWGFLSSLGWRCQSNLEIVAGIVACGRSVRNTG